MQQEILDIAVDLIKIPTTKYNTKNLYDAINYVNQIFQNYSNARIYRYDYDSKPSIIVQNFEGKRADVVLNGHLDVVPPSEENQLDPVFKQDKMYARWAGDMKSGCAVMIKVMETLLTQSFSDKKVSLILTTDEEVWGFSWAGRLSQEWWWGDIVIIPDWGSKQEVVIAEKWILLLEIKWYGVSCHGSRPWLGENAFDNVLKFYNMLKNYLEDPSRVYGPWNWWNTVNISKISGGDAINVIPGEIDARLDIRFIEEHSRDKLYENIKWFAQQCNCEIISYISWENLYTPEDLPELNKYINLAEETFWDYVKTAKEHWGSDWRFFEELGSNVFLHRPTTGNIHSKGEWVELNDLNRFYELYLKFIRN